MSEAYWSRGDLRKYARAGGDCQSSASVPGQELQGCRRILCTCDTDRSAGYFTACTAFPKGLWSQQHALIATWTARPGYPRDDRFGGTQAGFAYDRQWVVVREDGKFLTQRQVCKEWFAAIEHAERQCTEPEFTLPFQGSTQSTAMYSSSLP